jgi:antirestriction protein
MHEREPTPPLTEQDVSTNETQDKTDVRIYVASLSDYNNGILHGRWIDATDDADAMQAEVDEMLRSSPTARRYGEPAEEWAIHDYEGFGSLRLSEVGSLEYIARLADGIGKHGQAFAAWAAEVNSDPEQMGQFEERFQGEWESVESYAENLLDDMGAQKIIDDAPDWLQAYLDIDVAGFARDLAAGGDITTAETDEGRVWVWLGW